MRTVTIRDAAAGESALDELLDRTSRGPRSPRRSGVSMAGRLWSRGAAYAGYLAPLGREQHAAGVYGEQIELVKRVSR